MDDVEWPLVTVEFDSLRGHPMDGIYEVHILIQHIQSYKTFAVYRYTGMSYGSN
jgi:hypothetical protein